MSRKKWMGRLIVGAHGGVVGIVGMVGALGALALSVLPSLSGQVCLDVRELSGLFALLSGAAHLTKFETLREVNNGKAKQAEQERKL